MTGALTLREQAIEKTAYQQGWRDRESDFMAGVERSGMAVVTVAEAATLASLRAGTHVVVPREPTEEMLAAAFPASTAWGVWRLMLAASEAPGHE